jgi:hypothetical protein
MRIGYAHRSFSLNRSSLVPDRRSVRATGNSADWRVSGGRGEPEMPRFKGSRETDRLSSAHRALLSRREMIHVTSAARVPQVGASPSQTGRHQERSAQHAAPPVHQDEAGRRAPVLRLAPPAVFASVTVVSA